MQILTRSYKPRQCNVYLSGAPARGMAGAGDERDDQELGTRGMARARAVDERMAGAAGGVDRVAGIPRRNTGVGQAGAGGTVGREGGWRCSGGGGGGGDGRRCYGDDGDGRAAVAVWRREGKMK
jgi:hypothetical protein